MLLARGLLPRKCRFARGRLATPPGRARVRATRRRRFRRRPRARRPRAARARRAGAGAPRDRLPRRRCRDGPAPRCVPRAFRVWPGNRRSRTAAHVRGEGAEEVALPAVEKRRVDDRDVAGGDDAARWPAPRVGRVGRGLGVETGAERRAARSSPASPCRRLRSTSVRIRTAPVSSRNACVSVGLAAARQAVRDHDRGTRRPREVPRQIEVGAVLGERARLRVAGLHLVHAAAARPSRAPSRDRRDRSGARRAPRSRR